MISCPKLETQKQLSIINLNVDSGNELRLNIVTKARFQRQIELV